jgi:hypothetical protein
VTKSREAEDKNVSQGGLSKARGGPPLHRRCPPYNLLSPHP